MDGMKSTKRIPLKAIPGMTITGERILLGGKHQLAYEYKGTRSSVVASTAHEAYKKLVSRYGEYITLEMGAPRAAGRRAVQILGESVANKLKGVRR